MLKAKTLFTLVAVALLFAFVGSSFAKQFPGDRAGKKADYLYKTLKLTNDQYTKVYQTLFDYETKFDTHFVKGHKCTDACKTDITKNQAAALGTIEKTLTKDQVTKFTGMKDKFFKMSMKKRSKKNAKKDEIKDATKDVKKDAKKDAKKEDKKDAKKEVKKEEKKDAKKDDKKDVKKDDTKKDVKK